MVKIYTRADGEVIAQSMPFVLDGVAYPLNWLDLASPEELSERGISLQELPDPEPEPYVPPDPTNDGVIHSVTPRQARLALYGAGLLDQVETAVNAAGGTTKITWDHAAEISRQDPLILTLGAALGLSEEDTDGLFLVARTL